MNNSKERSVLVSVLNWNSASATTKCVKSLLMLDIPTGINIKIVVIDNGSEDADWNLLRSALSYRQVSLIREEKNLGFAGGHNIALRMAIKNSADYVWLVNSDAVVKPSALENLLQVLESNCQCGAASPLILALEDEQTIDFCGARHDWRHTSSISCTSVEEARAMEVAHPDDMWLMGAAIILRTDAIREVGLLDERLFAYYEDNDICARLASAGWLNKMAFDAVVLHSHPKSRAHEKAPYYFYLMARNSFRFWFKHTPGRYRRFLRLKLIDRAILMANRLHLQGLHSKVDACLLGVLDGQMGRTGVWNLDRRIPIFVQLLRRALWINHSKHL